MSISSDKVLNKMEELIHKAKVAETLEQKKSYATAIKALCELLSEEETIQPISEVVSSQRQTMSPQASVAEVASQKPMSIEEANGTSLLDF
ncbi:MULTISPECIES: DUF5327 family protein [Bacillus]|uniref:DUF5327 family protein n=1 Tax=Bacillus TaxID=1386 RepID=UPI00031BF149|nr:MULTISPECIES: DUF5327 family protein [Bacillus]